MTPEPVKTDPEKIDWTDIQKVFELIETDGRKLTVGEKCLIAGQRGINGILFEAIDALLKTFPDESAPPEIARVKTLLKDLPGKEPPGCRTGEQTDQHRTAT